MASALRRWRRPKTGLQIRPMSIAEFVDRLTPAFEIYIEAMGYPQSFLTGRVQLARTHLEYPDACAVGAFVDDELVGFGYGYRSEPGQWWHDEVTLALAAQPHLEPGWTDDAFELCELHVRKSWQGRGIGKELLELLISIQHQPTVLLSTPEGPTRAIALYRSSGFQPLAEQFRFSGDPRGFVIMGRR